MTEDQSWSPADLSAETACGGASSTIVDGSTSSTTGTIDIKPNAMLEAASDDDLDLLLALSIQFMPQFFRVKQISDAA